LLVTDLDGTLLDPAGHVHRSDAEAIRLLRRRGIPVSICTGRMYSGTRQIAQQLGIEGPVACVDGSHIVHVSMRRSLFTATLDRDAAEQLRQWLSQVGLPSFAFASDTIVHDPTGRRYLSLLRSWSERMVAVESVTSVEGWAPLKEISAVIAMGDKTAVDAVMTGMNGEQTAPSSRRLQMVSFPLRGPGVGNCWALLVRRADTDKGTALAWLADYHQVPIERVVAVGDWINDVPMFKVAGKSFVMSQAPAEVREAASFVLSAHTQVGGGIREAAERSGLL
jgi:hydroxymethylpyrimidine pyrophosphatase-like HAD family hydrolase